MTLPRDALADREGEALKDIVLGRPVVIRRLRGQAATPTAYASPCIANIETARVRESSARVVQMTNDAP